MDKKNFLISVNPEHGSLLDRIEGAQIKDQVKVGERLFMKVSEGIWAKMNPYTNQIRRVPNNGEWATVEQADLVDQASDFLITSYLRNPKGRGQHQLGSALVIDQNKLKAAPFDMSSILKKLMITLLGLVFGFLCYVLGYLKGAGILESLIN